MRDVIHLHQASNNSPGDPVVVDEPTTPMRPLHLTRPQAIAAIRERLAKLCDEEHCACSAAAHLGVMCKGFAAMTDDQLRKRFDWIARRRPDASREELERLVSLYHIGREEVGGFAALLRRRDPRSLRLRRMESVRQHASGGDLQGADRP